MHYTLLPHAPRPTPIRSHPRPTRTPTLPQHKERTVRAVLPPKRGVEVLPSVNSIPVIRAVRRPAFTHPCSPIADPVRKGTVIQAQLLPAVGPDVGGVTHAPAVWILHTVEEEVNGKKEGKGG